MIIKEYIKRKLRTMLTESRIPFKLPLPEDILQIKDVFKKNGYKLYVVGGAVRDAILGKQPKDFIIFFTKSFGFLPKL